VGILVRRLDQGTLKGKLIWAEIESIDEVVKLQLFMTPEYNKLAVNQSVNTVSLEVQTLWVPASYWRNCCKLLPDLMIYCTVNICSQFVVIFVNANATSTHREFSLVPHILQPFQEIENH